MNVIVKENFTTYNKERTEGCVDCEHQYSENVSINFKKPSEVNQIIF